MADTHEEIMARHRFELDARIAISRLEQGVQLSVGEIAVLQKAFKEFEHLSYLYRQHEDNHLPKHKLDVGAVKVKRPHEIEIQLDVMRENVWYRITVRNDHKTEIVELGLGGCISTGDNVLESELIGYAIRRAICRGIDESETAEDRVDNKASIRINLGEYPYHEKSALSVARTRPK